MRMKASMPRNVTLPLTSTPSVAGGSASDPSEIEESNTMDQAFNKEAMDELDCIIAKMFYTGELSFKLTRNPWYVKAFKFIANNCRLQLFEDLSCNMRNLT